MCCLYMQSLLKTEAGQYRYSCTYALNLLLGLKVTVCDPGLNWQDIAQGPLHVYQHKIVQMKKTWTLWFDFDISNCVATNQMRDETATEANKQFITTPKLAFSVETVWCIL